jgi:glycine hydroxymethyltransferase
VQPHSGADANLVAFFGILVQIIQNPRLEELGKKIHELSEEEHEELRTLMMGQKMLGMSLNAGGHLTHGYSHNISSKLLRSFHYDVNPKTGLLDYDQIEAQAKEIRPTILVAGYSSYPRLVNFARMREIADTTGAILLVDMAHFSGLVAGKALTGVYDPVPYAHVITSTTHKTLRGPRGGLVLCKKEFAKSINKGCPYVIGGPLPHVMAAKAVAFQEANTEGFRTYAAQIIKNARAMAERLIEHGCELVTGGTDNHLMVVDVLKSFNLTGRQAEKALRSAKINLNRNSIPFDQKGPWYTSGIRIGTPALTTLGMKESEMRLIADFIVKLLRASKAGVHPEKKTKSLALVDVEQNTLEAVSRAVAELLEQFPLYPEIIID